MLAERKEGAEGVARDEALVVRQDAARCPVCKGKDWLIYDVPYGHPKFGELLRCPACAEAAPRQGLPDWCGLPPRLRGITFDNIVRHPGNADAYDAAWERAQRPAQFLTFTGAPGVGKSTLLAAIINYGRANGLSAHYTTLADLLDRYRATFRADAETDYESIQEHIKNVRLLCIDEFDRFKASEWAQEKLFQLVNARYDYGEDRLTCFATNAGIAAFPDYLQSRMGDRYCGAGIPNVTVGGPV